MPNHVINIVAFKGPEDRIEDLIKNVAYDDHKEGVNTLDFNKVIPMPRLIKESESGSNTANYINAYLTYVNPECNELDDAIPDQKPVKVTAATVREYCKLFKTGYRMALDTDEIPGKMTKKQLDQLIERAYVPKGKPAMTAATAITNGVKTLTAIKLYDGCCDWYEWSCKNWGTKWNSYEPFAGDKHQIIFETAWCTPIPVILALSKKYPDLKITTYYADEDIGNNCGYYVAHKGKCIEDWYPDEGKADGYAEDIWDCNIEKWAY